MSKSNKKSTPPAGNRREQLQQQRERESRDRKIRNGITFGVLGVALIAIIGIVVWVAVSVRSTPEAAGGGAVTGDYSIVVGNDDAPVTIAIYQDFMCPYCGLFERTNRDDLQTLVDAGTAKIEFHVVSYQDQYSQGTEYSTRAANAFVAVAKAEPDKVMAFNAALFDDQPEENTPGLSDAEIAERARAAGVSNDVIATFAQQSNRDFVANATNQATYNDQITGTPTVRINGEDWPGDNSSALYEAGQLKAAVEEAAAQQ